MLSLQDSRKNRLKTFLGKTISEEQTGGIPGRKIAENLNSIRNIIEFYSSNCSSSEEDKQNGAAILSLDFEKAYDRVERHFLFQTMDKLGFNPKFIK